MRSITAPNADGQYLYIFQANGLYKVGISNNPEYRSNQIRKKLNSPVGMMYIGKVRYGRTIDAETLVHRDLSQHNVPVDYNDGTTSPEWFGCSIGKVLSTCQKYADMY
jgi:septin family protein